MEATEWHGMKMVEVEGELHIVPKETDHSPRNWLQWEQEARGICGILSSSDNKGGGV